MKLSIWNYFSKSLLTIFHLFQGFRQSYIRSGPSRSIPSIRNQRSLGQAMVIEFPNPLFKNETWAMISWNSCQLWTVPQMPPYMHIVYIYMSYFVCTYYVYIEANYAIWWVTHLQCLLPIVIHFQYSNSENQLLSKTCTQYFHKICYLHKLSNGSLSNFKS